MVILCLIFWETTVLFSIVTAPFYICTSNVQGFQFLPILITLVIFLCLFICYNSHPNECVVVSHCDFDLHFPSDYWFWLSSHVLIGHLCIFFREMSIQVLWPFFNWVVFFVCFWVIAVLYMFWILIHYWIYNF